LSIHILRHGLGHALPLPLALALNHFFVKQLFNTDSASLGSEMTSQGISSGKSPATTPLTTGLEIALANELLLA
jgi:hypothetical protein